MLLKYCVMETHHTVYIVICCAVGCRLGHLETAPNQVLLLRILTLDHWVLLRRKETQAVSRCSGFTRYNVQPCKPFCIRPTQNGLIFVYTLFVKHFNLFFGLFSLGPFFGFHIFWRCLERCRHLFHCNDSMGLPWMPGLGDRPCWMHWFFAVDSLSDGWLS